MPADTATETYRTMSVTEWAPSPLPADWSEERLDEHGHRRLIAYAASQDFQVCGEITRTSDERGAHPTVPELGMGRLVTWSAEAVHVEAPGEVVVKGAEQPDGSWVADLPEPHNGGVYAIQHGLDTMSVAVACQRADGSGIGLIAAVPIDSDEVNLVAVPDTARVTLTEAADDDEDAQQGDPGA